MKQHRKHAFVLVTAAMFLASALALPAFAVIGPGIDPCAAATVPAGYGCLPLDEPSGSDPAAHGTVFWTRTAANDLTFIINAESEITELQICVRTTAPYAPSSNQDDKCSGSNGSGIGDRVHQSDPVGATTTITIDLDNDFGATTPILPGQSVYFVLHVNQGGRTTTAQGVAGGVPNSPTPVAASAAPGACAFSNGNSTTPVTASISPAGGATVALSKTGTGLVHTFPTNGVTYTATPGDYTWVATATNGYAVSPPASGLFTVNSCAPTPTPVGASANPGVCQFANNLSTTPVTASISPAGGATVVLSKTGTGPVYTFTSNVQTYNAAPGAYTWVATANPGYVLSGISSDGFAVGGCAPNPTPASASASAGTCVFANSVSSTPITSSISPPAGAVVALSKAGTVVHTFPTDGASYNAAPGAYTWAATASPGYVLSGASTGGLTSASCSPSPAIVLGTTFEAPPPLVETGPKATRVLGVKLARTGAPERTVPLLALALALMLAGGMTLGVSTPVGPLVATVRPQREWRWELGT